MKDETVWRTGTHLGVISFASRLERIALQAADLLAFCLYHVEEYSVNTSKPQIAYALHYLAADAEHVKKLDQEAIDLLLPGYPKSLREADEKQSRIRTGQIRCCATEDALSLSRRNTET